jgi:hypothetical protein
LAKVHTVAFAVPLPPLPPPLPPLPPTPLLYYPPTKKGECKQIANCKPDKVVFVIAIK